MAQWNEEGWDEETNPHPSRMGNGENWGSPCGHPLNAHSRPWDSFRKTYKATCPRCDTTYYLRKHIFTHPMTYPNVVEWAETGPWGARVYPVPSRLTFACDSPLWSDMNFVETPEEPQPFVIHPTVDIFDTATTKDLEHRGYTGLLSILKAETKKLSEWKKPSARLIVMAMPVTVNGHVAAYAADILLATPWWRLPSGHTSVIAFCPRLGRGVVMHHSFAAVPRPLRKALPRKALPC